MCHTGVGGEGERISFSCKEQNGLVVLECLTPHFMDFFACVVEDRKVTVIPFKMPDTSLSGENIDTPKGIVLDPTGGTSAKEPACYHRRHKGGRLDPLRSRFLQC